MSEKTTFPSWINEVINRNQDQLGEKPREFFDKLTKLFPDFDQAFLTIPNNLDIGVLNSYDLRELNQNLGTDWPRELILLTTAELMHFQFVYQMRELGLSLFSALNEGRFYVAAIVTRAMLEVVCVNYYTFSRAEAKLNDSLAFLRSAVRTKSPTEKAILIEKYYTGLHEIFLLFDAANNSSSISWPDYAIDRTIDKSKTEKYKKINTSTAIQDMDKKSKLPLIAAYDLLSEFVHPNAGSKMLIVNTRQIHMPMMDSLRIGGNKYNVEAALFFFDYLSESAYYLFTLSLSLFQRGQVFIAAIENLSPHGSPQNVH